MAETLGKAYLYLVADDTGLKKGLDQAETQARGFKDRMGGILKGALAVGAAGTLAGIAAIGVGLTKAVQAGSDAEEMLAKFGVVFSTTSQQVQQDMNDLADATGRSRFELMGMASTFGDTLKPLGFTEEAAASTSAQLVALATDLSSFNNMPMDEALRRLQGTLIGSHENALAFGVVINENMLKAELAAQGWDKLTGAELEQAKVQARINLLMRGTTDAQGDAIRTSDSWANQMRALKAELGDAATEIGLKLLPALTPLLQALVKLAQEATPLVIDAIEWFTETGVPIIADFGKAIKKMVDFVMPIFKNLRKTVDDDVTGRFAWMKDWLDTNLPLIQNLIETVTGKMMEFWENHGEAIKTLIDNTFGTLGTIIDTALQTIAGIVQLALQLLNGDWEGAGETLKTIVQTIWDGIKEIFSLQFDSLRTIFGEFDWASIGNSLMEGIADGIRNGASKIADAARDAAHAALDAAKRMLGIGSPSRVAAMEVGAPFAQGIGLGIDRELTAMRRNFATGLGGMVQAFGGQAAAAGPVSIVVNVSGNGDYGTGRSVGRGIMDELRARGLR